MISDAQAQVELERIRRLDTDQNGKIYPKNSLHARGFPSPTCHLCSVLLALEYVLERKSKSNGLRPRTTANLTTEELNDLQGFGRTIERKTFVKARVVAAQVNNLYDLD